MTTLAELTSEMLRLSKLLDEALENLRDRAHEYAEAEDAYRLKRAKAYLAAEGTVAERNSEVDLATSDERRRAHLADALKQEGLERVRARRAQLSALQTMANAHREEAAFARTGPDDVDVPF